MGSGRMFLENEMKQVRMFVIARLVIVFGQEKKKRGLYGYMFLLYIVIL